MSGEFLTEQQAMAYGRYGGPLTRGQLERYFFLDDADKALVAQASW
ncbi:hypothetical protein [Streptosporangium sp. NPDC006930]